MVETSAFPSPVRGGVWLSLSSILFLMCAAGTMYAFGLWSPVLKDVDGYALNQFHLASLASYSNLGEFINPDIGLFVGAFGTVAGMTLGVGLVTLGYFCIWLAVTVYDGQAPFACLAFSCWLYGHGCGALINACMTEILTAFAPFAGYAVGSTKAIFGLAAAIMSVMYFAVCQDEPRRFPLYLSAYTAISGAVCIPIIQSTRGKVEETKRNGSFKFRILCAAIGGLALLLGVSQAFASSLSLTAWRAILIATTCIALTSFLLACSTGNAHDDRLLTTPDHSAKSVLAPTVDVQGSAWALFLRLDFYILMLALIISQGCGLVILNSAAQLPPSIEGKPISSQSFIGILSVFNCFGRLSFGGASDELASVASRPWWVVAGAAIIGFSQLALYLDSRRLLWFGAAGVAFGYGGIFGVQSALVKELFGSRDLSLKLAFANSAALFGSFIFGTHVTGRLYDDRAKRLGTAPDCFDPSCFQTAFLVCAISCLVAICLAAVLAVRTAWIYNPAAAAGKSYGSMGGTSKQHDSS